jgi:MFS family permease
MLSFPKFEWEVPLLSRQYILGQSLTSTLNQRPTSIISLTCGSSLLLAGSFSDIVGGSTAYILGSSLQILFALGCGVSRSGTQLILFRGLGGIATALCLSSAVSIIDTVFPGGRRRNLAFASMGGGQPAGFGIGVTLGGVCAGTIGWRWGFRITCLLNLAVLIVASLHLPRKKSSITWRRMLLEVDWIGSLLLTSSFAMLLYVLS